MLSSFDNYGKRLSGEANRFLRYYLNDFLNQNSFSFYSFINWLENKKLADSTKRTISTGLGTFLKEQKHISNKEYAVLLHKYTRKEKSHAKLTNDVLNLIFDNMNKSYIELTKWRNLLFLYVMVFTGEDAKSILNIKKNEFYAGPENITIKFNDNTTKISNNVLIKDYTIKYIFDKYIKLRIDNSWFFVNGTGTQLSLTYIEILFNNISKKIGIKILPNDFKIYKKGLK